MAHKGFIGSTATYRNAIAMVAYDHYATMPRVAIRPVRRITKSLQLPAGLMEAKSNVGSIVIGGAVGDGSGRRWVQGIVKEAGVPVSRQFTVHRRDTKGIVAKGDSSLNGHFTASWRGYSGKVFIVFFDNTAVGADYNCQIVDLVDSVS